MPRVSAACALLLLATGVATSGAFTNFESGHVRPLAITPDGAWLLAVDTPDARLAVYALTPSGATLAADVPVGLEPVAVAARINAGGRPEAWIVNHLSDSVSIVEIDPVEPARSRVTRTLLVGDEPRDIVFAGTSGRRAFVTAAHRGQNRPGDPQLTTEGVGRADVWAFDADDPRRGARRHAAGDHPALRRHAARAGREPRRHASSTRPSSSPAIARRRCSRRVVSPNGGLPPPPPGATPGAPRHGAHRAARPATRWIDELDRDWSACVAFSLPDLDVFRDRRRCRPAGARPVRQRRAASARALQHGGATDDRHALRLEHRGPQPRALRAEAARPPHRKPHHRRRRHERDAGAPEPAHRVRRLTGAAIRDRQQRRLPAPTWSSRADGATLYVAAFGSGVVAVVDAAALEAGTHHAGRSFPSATARAALRSTPTATGCSS